MDLLAFLEQFPDEAACEARIIETRWPQGFICEHCNGTKAWYLTARRSFECASCHKQRSITAGTVFHKTRVPLREWFLLIHLLATSKKGMSVLALQRQLPQHEENTIRLMLRKLKAAMADREAIYQLAGVIEVDDAFFGGRYPGGKAGRGSENKQKVLVSVALSEEDKPTDVKFKVVESLDKNTIEKTLTESIKPASMVVTDGYKGFNGLSEIGFEHVPFTMQTPKDNQAYLPWVHILISNAKRFILGTHHSVKYLQSYLDEFSWRFNRRFCNLFERLLNTGLSWKPAYAK